MLKRTYVVSTQKSSFENSQHVYSLKNKRAEFLILRPDFRLSFQVLAMSSRSWLSYAYQNRFHLTPLSYETLEYASGFASEQCPEGIVAISTNTLR